ncbi:MAG: dephospho-CoA kinase [Victivallales bacterium]|nr:dephospho-CoA kinase [Victivallales bacterium]
MIRGYGIFFAGGMLVFLGLTGGIGSGKSTALGFLAEMGWRTNDADGICHSLLGDADGYVGREVRARFGDSVIGSDCSISRAVLGQMVLDDDDGRVWLENLLHPLVLERVAEERARAGKSVKSAFDIPLLFEVGWGSFFDRTVLVYAGIGERMARLARRGISEARSRAFIGIQAPLEDKIGKADHVLVNNGGKELLKLQCERLDRELTLLLNSVKSS